MKKILTILLAGASTLAFAQKKSHLSGSIDDDGKTLSIHVTGTIDGKNIQFDKKCNVSGSSKDEHIYSSAAGGAFQLQPDSKTSVITGQEEFTKHVRFNPESGVLFLRYRFLKRGEEYIYEKTVDAIDKTESQRKRIIEEFENEIELPGKELNM